MASSDTANRREGKDVVMEEEEEEDDNLDELEGFDDFTLASSWERFISEIEAVCRQWLLDGPKNLIEKGAECLGSPKNLYKVKCELKNGMKSYSVEHYFEICSNDKAQEWDGDVHNLQLSFGVHDFMVIAPLSASGVVLDSPESCKLLSAVAIALSNCGSNWPAFVPVHDPSRKAYIGIQNMGTIFTRRFDADRIGSQVPIKLMHMEGLYELFVSKFALYPSEFSTSSFKVHFSMKLTYRTPPFDDEDDNVENIEHEFKDVGGDADNLTRIKPQWDDECPWAEWYSAEDPVKGFELIAIWSSKIYEDSLEMAELENASSLDAEKWLIYPIITQNMIDDSPRKLIGFASQLNLLVSALDMSFQAQFLEDFVSAEKQGSDNSKSAVSIPPPSVLDRVLKELFHDGNQISSFPEFEDKNSRAIKGAPLRSPFSQFCLQSLWFGNCNIRAIAALWIEFVRELRWCWEESQPLPGMSTDLSIDLSACLVHQKLQMLAVCIRKKSLLDHDNDKSNGSRGHKSSSKKEDFQAESNQSQEDFRAENNQSLHRSYKEHLDDRHNSSLRSDSCYGPERTVTSFDVDRGNADTFPDPQPSNAMRMGSAGVIGSMVLLHSFQKMHAPYTQDPPIMTEDMHEERLQAVEAFGDAFSFSGQLERDILSSDMSAFKAANPDAVFEDFIRWHSPGDWESSETEVRFEDQNTELQGCNWPPRGRLSERMSEHGNSWRQIWNDSPPVPASEQKPLFDPIREGEKVLHYLETLRPHQLLEQMICTAFKAAADTLNLTSYGGFNLMKTKLSQLYLTIASTLKPLQGNHLLDKAELIGDLKRLCRVFEHIEKLLILATSIHRKLLDAPRLSEAIFNDYFNFYLPKMGNSLTSICYNKKFSNKQQVNMHERDAVASLFPPPTANQSWRKVLSMGNLLNGHEPILREIIFRAYDRLSSSHYGISDLCFPTEEIETNRMYICGTSNDLRVALSVTSWD